MQRVPDTVARPQSRDVAGLSRSTTLANWLMPRSKVSHKLRMAPPIHPSGNDLARASPLGPRPPTRPPCPPNRLAHELESGCDCSDTCSSSTRRRRHKACCAADVSASQVSALALLPTPSPVVRVGAAVPPPAGSCTSPHTALTRCSPRPPSLPSGGTLLVIDSCNASHREHCTPPEGPHMVSVPVLRPPLPCLWPQ
jgi:hypothetical protein